MVVSSNSIKCKGSKNWWKQVLYSSSLWTKGYTNKPIEDKGIVEFQAKAEVHFVPLDEGGISFSNGEYLILGSLEWKDDNWTIVDQLVIKDWVNTLNLQKWEKDEQGDI